MKVMNIVALLSLVVIGFGAHAYNHDESVDAAPVVVSLDCVSQVDSQTAVINPKCLANETVATIQITPQMTPVTNCLAQCARMTNVAESSACYSRCYGGR